MDTEPYNVVVAKKGQTHRKVRTQSHGSNQLLNCTIAGPPKLTIHILDSLANNEA